MSLETHSAPSPPAPGFDAALLSGLDEPVRRYDTPRYAPFFVATILSATPLA